MAVTSSVGSLQAGVVSDGYQFAGLVAYLQTVRHVVWSDSEIQSCRQHGDGLSPLGTVFGFGAAVACFNALVIPCFSSQNGVGVEHLVNEGAP